MFSFDHRTNMSPVWEIQHRIPPFFTLCKGSNKQSRLRLFYSQSPPSPIWGFDAFLCLNVTIKTEYFLFIWQFKGKYKQYDVITTRFFLEIVVDIFHKIIQTAGLTEIITRDHLMWWVGHSLHHCPQPPQSNLHAENWVTQNAHAQRYDMHIVLNSSIFPHVFWKVTGMNERSRTSGSRAGQCSSLANNSSDKRPKDKRKKF